MKIFTTTEQMINAKAKQTLKSYAYDQPESIEWTIAGLRREILKERVYIAKKVTSQYHSYCEKKWEENVPAGKKFIMNFGYALNEFYVIRFLTIGKCVFVGEGFIAKGIFAKEIKEARLFNTLLEADEMANRMRNFFKMGDYVTNIKVVKINKY